MKIRIVQIRNNNNGGWIAIEPNNKPVFQEKGWVEAETFDADDCWNLCNWSCWTDERPENLHSDLTYCNSDVAFWDPWEETWWVADHVGWIRVKTEEEMKEALRGISQ